MEVPKVRIYYREMSYIHGDSVEGLVTPELQEIIINLPVKSEQTNNADGSESVMK